MKILEPNLNIKNYMNLNIFFNKQYKFLIYIYKMNQHKRNKLKTSILKIANKFQINNLSDDQIHR